MTDLLVQNTETSSGINVVIDLLSTTNTKPVYGMNRLTGRLMTGAEHLQQSIVDILITRTNTRVMLRNYGSGLPERIDKPQNATWLAELFISIAEALDNWEPRFNLTSINAEQGDYAGQPIITLTGEATL